MGATTDKTLTKSRSSQAATDDLLALDEALTRLTAVQPRVAELVQLRYFAGLTIPDAAALLGISPRTADGWWAYARGWRFRAVEGADPSTPSRRILAGS